MASILQNRCNSLPDTLGERYSGVDDPDSMADDDAGGDDDIQSDSIRCFGVEPLLRDTTVLYDQLINIAEEMGEDDFDLLKFLCRDHITVSMLEAASSALDVFECMKKSLMIDTNNVDFLLECFVRMHRLDLIRKLGFDPRLIKQQLAKLDGVFPFRVLLLEIAEDLTDKEFDTIKFFLSGRIKKKTLQEKKTLQGLFVFMEQELLLSDDNLDLLVDMMTAIKRGDLVDIVNSFRGIPKQRPPGQITPNTNTNNQTAVSHGNQQQTAISRANAATPMGDNSSRIVPMGDTSRRIVPTGMVDPPRVSDQMERSPSAGTMSVPSENEATSDETSATIPEAVFLQICQDLKVDFLDLGIELGYTNVQVDEFCQQWADPGERTAKLLRDWMGRKLDPGQIAPGLLYVLQKLGRKQSEGLLQRWMNTVGQAQAQGYSAGGQKSEVTESLNEKRLKFLSRNSPVDVNLTVTTGEAQQTFRPDQFLPKGPPTENNYTSLRPAQVYVPSQTEVQNTSHQNHSDSRPPRETIVNPVVNMQRQFEQMNLTDEERSRQLSSIQQLAATQQLAANQQLIYPGQSLPGQPLPHQSLSGRQLSEATSRNIGQTVAKNTTTAELPRYRMDRNPRGYCLIINNRDFYVDSSDKTSKPMPPRNGTDKDAELIEARFTAMNFLVVRKDNLADTDMMTFLVTMAHNVDHSNFDCFVCCILTHGVLNSVYGSNGRTVSIKDLTRTYQANRCKSLAGKPKLFFIQACQGRDKMGGEMEKDGPVPYTDAGLETDQPPQGAMIPNEADFVLGYATVPGYVSFRSRNHGTWFIRKLCQMLERYAKSEDLVSILVKVNEEVSNANANVDGGVFKQTPAPMVTLRKKLFFS